MLIARLIADPARLQSGLDTAREALAEKGIALARAGLLEHEGDVLQLSFADGNRAMVREVLENAFDPAAAILSTEPFAVPDLFVSDMDSTMIGQECIDELADFAGLKPQVAAITERAMRGELDFGEALRERVGLLAGLEEDAIARCLAERIRPEPGARALVQTLKRRGCRCVLVTGGFHHFADRVAELLGFDRVVGNRLAVNDGRLTGGLEGPISDASTKLATLREEAAALGEGAVVLAAGDGANDIPMLEAANYGIAYRAKPAARSAANGWIDRGDLTALLDLLEIPRGEWAQ